MLTASTGVSDLIVSTIAEAARDSPGATKYRSPEIGFASADDPEFARLRRVVDPRVLLPRDLLAGARSVVSYFLPFDRAVVAANARHRSVVAEEWIQAYVETNTLLATVAATLIERLSRRGIRAAARPATGEFDRRTLTSPWSHKSAAVIAGVGRFGVHRMVITKAGCAGRFGSLVLDAEVPPSPRPGEELCLALRGGLCLECVERCPVGALRPDGTLDGQRCWARCHAVAATRPGPPAVAVCGKCAVRTCALGVPGSN